MMMIMLMGWDYVCELQPPTGLLFIHHLIYEHGEHGGMILTVINSWFIHQSSLAILLAESSSSRGGGTGKGNDEFCLTKFLFLTAIKSYDMGLTALLPLWRKVCCGFFITLNNPSPLAGYEPVNLGSNSKHANCYTTKDNFCCRFKLLKILREFVQVFISVVSIIISMQD
jgi:hypothetical protein